MLRRQARRALGDAARRKGSGMEGIDQLGRAHAQRRMRPGVAIDGRHGRAQIEPKFGIGLAEAHGARTNDELFITDRTKHCLIEACGPVEIANCDGDVINHAPERTSL